MKIRDWTEAGLEPLFGHEGEWLIELLERLEAGEAAAYALRERRAGKAGRRFLVAADLGLLDAWAPDVGPGAGPRDEAVSAFLTAWRDVRGVRIDCDIAVDAALRHEFRWRLRIESPSVDEGGPAAEDALLELATECVRRAGADVDPVEEE